MKIPRAVLFDLDGTLADTAPDLAEAANLMRRARGMVEADYYLLRAQASSGARGLIRVAFGITPQDAEFEAMREEFLRNYQAVICVKSKLFEGVPHLLKNLQAQHIVWGIVTNKAARFTVPFVQAIGLQAAVCVSGDTTPHAKPHPAPLLHAAENLKISAEDCWYVGDDLRDIQAGNAAGMRTIAVRWGYCGNPEPIEEWGANHIVNTPQELSALIQSTV